MNKKVKYSFLFVGAMLVVFPDLVKNVGLKNELFNNFSFASIGLIIMGIVFLAEYYYSNFTDRIFKHWAENIAGIFLILLGLTDLIVSDARFVIYIILDVAVIAALFIKKHMLQKDIDENWKKNLRGRFKRF